MKVWIVAEQHGRQIAPVSFELLERARRLDAGGGIGAMVIGPALEWEPLEELIARGADTVLAYESEELDFFQPEPFSACLEALNREFSPEVVLGAATSSGRVGLPYAAMRLGAGLTADCTELEWQLETGLLLQTRPAIGGNIMATIQTPLARPQMATVRPRSTPQAMEIPMHPGQIIRRRIPAEWLPARQRLLRTAPNETGGDLASASRIVVAGRGIRKAENLRLVEALAARLGAAVGATREVVDRGWLPYACQVGLSGRTVTPELYVGVGVSGAIQHQAGMQTAKRIVALNRDPEAPIFRLADLGVVGDLFEVIPAWLEQLDREEQPS